MDELIERPFGKILGIDYGFTKIPFDFDSFFKDKEYVTLKQVHSNVVHFINDEEKDLHEGDGIFTTRKNLYSIIKTADCYPLLFYDLEQGFSGALHVGWKGLSKRIIVSLYKIISSNGFSIKSTTKFLIGPGICGKCYEVGKELNKIFTRVDLFKNCVKEKNSKYYLDIRCGIMNELLNLGVENKSIYDSKICNFESEDFFSYRRGDKGKRIYSFIAIL